MRRSDFLDRTRAGAVSAILPQIAPDDPGGLVPDMVDVDHVTRFVEAASAAGAEIHEEPPRMVIDELIAHYSIESFISWDIDQIHGLPDLPVSITRIDAEIGAAAESRRARNAQFSDVGMGITGADAGFAETGTIVVSSGAGRPRMASLVPPVHLAVLSPQRISRSLSHWMADANSIPDATNVVFITGPSKTGDIESIITTGVHGPRHLHIVLLAD